MKPQRKYRAYLTGALESVYNKKKT